MKNTCERIFGRRRDAAILIVVLVCLGIASSMTVTAMQSSLRARREMSRQWQLEQTRWLLDAGIRQAMNSATKTDQEPDNDSAPDAAVAGETWDVTDSVSRCSAATITITPVESSAGDDAAVFEVTAVIENEDSPPVQTRRSRVIRLAPVVR